MMIVRSQWRVKVAISVVIFFTVHFAEGQSVSKDSFQKTVSIQGQRISFEEVLNRLSKQTKLYFIYSSNSIELNKQLTLHIIQRPLQEVLEHLEKTLNVAFRREGNYVVVKATHEVKVVSHVEKLSVSRKPAVAEKAGIENIGEYQVAASKRYSVIEHSTIMPYDLLKKNLLSCSPAVTSIDTSNLKKYFPLSITNPRPKSSLFTSFGLMANEYSGGVEMRVGIPAIYGVVSTGLMSGGSFRVGYGLGTSIPIKPKVWLNPIYTFAKVTEEEDYLVDGNFNLLMQNGLKIKGKHHQMKFLFQLQISRRLMAHVGPSINFLNTTYEYDKAFFNAGLISTNVITPSPVGGYYPTQTRLIRTVYYSSPPNYSTFKTWVGFEAGLSYLVKFSRR